MYTCVIIFYSTKLSFSTYQGIFLLLNFLIEASLLFHIAAKSDTPVEPQHPISSETQCQSSVPENEQRSGAQSHGSAKQEKNEVVVVCLKIMRAFELCSNHFVVIYYCVEDFMHDNGLL